MPRWSKTIELKHVFHNNEMTFTERRDAIVRILRGSGWLDSNANAADIVDELAEVGHVSEFDSLWQQLYDEADADRVWISTF